MIQIDTTTRAAWAQALLTAIETGGGSPQLQLWDNSAGIPVSPQAAAVGTQLVQITMPVPPFINNGDGTLTQTGDWSGFVVLAAGTMGYFRVLDSTSVTRLQGTITLTGGGGDMTFDDIVVTLVSAIAITGFTLTMGNR